MGAIEEGGKVASSITTALQGNPLCLALLVMNVGLLVFLFYADSADTANRQLLFKEILSGQQTVQQLIARCPPPGGNK